MPNAVWLRFYKMPFAKVYPAYLAKVERKGRSKAELDEIIRWLTGYTQDEIEAAITDQILVEPFFTQAPAPNPARSLITGTICGDRVQDIEEPLKREVRYLDKMIDELAKGKAMEKILREPA